MTPTQIKKLRRRLGDNQQEFAARLGVSHQYISHLESGVRRNPSTLVLNAIRRLAEDEGIEIESKSPGKKPRKK